MREPEVVWSLMRDENEVSNDEMTTLALWWLKKNPSLSAKVLADDHIDHLTSENEWLRKALKDIANGSMFTAIATAYAALKGRE